MPRCPPTAAIVRLVTQPPREAPLRRQGSHAAYIEALQGTRADDHPPLILLDARRLKVSVTYPIRNRQIIYWPISPSAMRFAVGMRDAQSQTTHDTVQFRSAISEVPLPADLRPGSAFLKADALYAEADFARYTSKITSEDQGGRLISSAHATRVDGGAMGIVWQSPIPEARRCCRLGERSSPIGDQQQR